jgi:hypothetical protein
MATRFEKYSESQLKKYLKLAHQILKSEGVEIDRPEEFLGLFVNYNRPTIDKKLEASAGFKFQRLDIEYLFYVLKNNPFHYVEDKELNRPEFKYKDCDFVTEERVRIRYTRSEEVETFLDDDFDSDYLEQLRQYDEVSPWDWDITDQDEREGDVIDDWFDVNN